MPNSPVCTEATLETQLACYKLPMDQHDRLAIRIWANMLELAQLGGTNYTADLPGLMAASCAWRKWSNDLREAAAVAVAINNATNAGASVPANANAWVSAVKCLRGYSNSDLEAMLGALQCRLGYHETIT